MKKVFQNRQTLVKNLREKAKNYPLLTKLYLPIIEKHANKYPSFVDFDYWLLIPYFQYLWKPTKITNTVLCETEKDLDRIYKTLGDKEFKTLCSDFLEFGLHPTVEGIHNKILDFFGELSGILYFIDRGYNIERIPRRNKKSPDFIARKDNEVAIIECKFKHISNPVKSFIDRYIRYRNLSPKFRASDSIKPWHLFHYSGNYYSENRKDLTEPNIRDLVKFLDQIIVDKPISREVNLKENCKVIYERTETIRPNLVTIENQVDFFKNELKKFLYKDVTRKTNQALPQFTAFDKENQKKYIYIFFELDPEYNLPYKEMDVAKKQVLEDFLQKHNLDIEIIVEVFPPIKSKKNPLNAA